MPAEFVAGGQIFIFCYQGNCNLKQQVCKLFTSVILDDLIYAVMRLGLCTFFFFLVTSEMEQITVANDDAVFGAKSETQ